SRFLREARAAANIHHANVARVPYDVENDVECFYAMQLLEGETLDPRVRRDGPMPLALALEVIDQAARASAAAAPCRAVQPDINGLGVTLWYLLGGRTPFIGRTMEEIRARQTSELPLEQLRSLHLPGQVITLLKSMLASDPKDRPQTARDLLSAVHGCYTRFNPEARSRRKKAVLAGAALVLAIAAVALGSWLYQRTRSFTPMERSIAVLPFENLSSDKENAYFAEGIQDEILTRLSKIADLKVISRTSTQNYKSAPKNLPEIAKQLGVAHVLEGSVQKNADAVRVNVQLIKAANDSHLWSDTLDRKLTDIFLVESEVAKAIAEQLRAKLTGQEAEVIAAKPTDSPQAYDAYLRGLAYTLKTGFTPANSLGAQKYLKEAVQLDPKFA